MAREVIKDALTEGAKATPPLVVLGKSIAEGWTINHTVAALTIVYLLMQIEFIFKLENIMIPIVRQLNLKILTPLI